MDMTPEDWISFSDQGPSKCKRSYAFQTHSCRWTTFGKLTESRSPICHLFPLWAKTLDA